MYSIFISSNMSIENRRKKIAEFVHLDEYNPNVIASASFINNENPELFEKDEWPNISTDKGLLIKKQAQCMENEVTTISPLIKDEKLIDDFVSCLKLPFKQYSAGIAVLRRKTSYGTIYYFAKDYVVDVKTGDIKFIYKHPVAPTILKSTQLNDVAESFATQLLKKFAMALAGKVAGGIGSELLKAIFPDGQTIDYTQLLGDLAQIVKDANADQTVAEQGGVVNGVINLMNGYYYNRKISQAKKEELYQFLLTQQVPLNIAIGKLMQNDFKEKGIATFISAAQVDFTIYQELAIQDYNVTNPLDSSNIKSLKAQVDNYTTFGNAVIAQIITEKVDARSNMIKKPYIDPFSGGEDPKNYWYYFDNKTNQRFGPWIDYKNSNAEGKCTESYNAYKTNVENAERVQDTQQCQNWSDMIAQWLLLKDKPLG